ncbi:hypothetical protein [Rhizobium sp. RCAM05973]|uniref:hypothetical protein n=1 Tax=Rhizobium sp. RCAM05973 TaxID=2994066 RepID=UPI0022EC00EA|nr:hypothetical protein [Rhizobium sp. RCAM05973]
MNEPEVKQWLGAQLNDQPAASDPGTSDNDQMSVLSGMLGHTRHHLEVVSGAGMTLPYEVMTASEKLEREGRAVGVLRIIIQIVILFSWDLWQSSPLRASSIPSTCNAPKGLPASRPSYRLPGSSFWAGLCLRSFMLW